MTAAVRADGTDGALKIGTPRMEGEDEIRGLRFRDGDPTVRLLMADDDLGAMLLERCEPRIALRALPEHEQDVVISALLRRLWRAPSVQYRFCPLSALAEYRSRQTPAHIGKWPDAGLVREGVRLLAELPRTGPADLVLVWMFARVAAGRETIGATAIWWHSLEHLPRKLHPSAGPLPSRPPPGPGPGASAARSRSSDRAPKAGSFGSNSFGRFQLSE